MIRTIDFMLNRQCGTYPFAVSVLWRWKLTSEPSESRTSMYQGSFLDSRRPGPLPVFGGAAEADAVESVVGPLASLPASDSLSRYREADRSDPMLSTTAVSAILVLLTLSPPHLAYRDFPFTVAVARAVRREPPASPKQPARCGA